MPVWSRPRVLTTSLETMTLDPASTETTVSVDLRIDDVDVYPLPGAPSGAPRLFRMAWGLRNSVLEGAVVERATGIL